MTPNVLRRVRKGEIRPASDERQDGLHYCLECWKIFMNRDDRDLSAARMKLRSAETSQRQPYESDPFGEQYRADLAIGEATNAMIDSLRHIARWAIYHKYGITTVWAFPNADFVAEALRAEVELEEKLRNNLATATRF